MAKITFTNLKLKMDTSVSVIKYNDSEIEVLKYLPIEEKDSLINLVIQNSFVDGIYDPLLIDTLFHLYLVYMYTNISFTEKQKESPLKLYDAIKSVGLLDEILKEIPEGEYNSLLTFLDETIAARIKYNKSIAGIIQNILEIIPEQSANFTKMLEEFDMSKYQNVLDFAKAANGGRDI